MYQSVPNVGKTLYPLSWGKNHQYRISEIKFVMKDQANFTSTLKLITATSSGPQIFVREINYSEETCLTVFKDVS